MKGSYLLIIWLGEEKRIKTRGREFDLNRGFYVYVGSAMNSLEKRVGRHFRREKKLHWHIDFLLEKGTLLRAYLIPSGERLEEVLSKEVSKYGEPVKGFGASDIGVPSNLYRFDDEPDDVLISILEERKLDWKRIKSPDEIKDMGERYETENSR
ncbi:GIY-YIG nuclease family protein [Thermococcus sp.]